MQWTDERVERLKKLWADGLSASQIAAELGGVTRNAVIGKVHRLGLSGRAKAVPTAASRMRAKPAATQHRPQTTAAVARPAQPSFSVRGNVALAASPEIETRPVPTPRIVPVQIVETAAPVCERVTIMELRESMCRWPLGDPSQADFRFCGGRCTPGQPYCTHHAGIAYQPSHDRRRDRRPNMVAH
jgi:GcrA cell cycle regulator